MKRKSIFLTFGLLVLLLDRLRRKRSAVSDHCRTDHGDGGGRYDFLSYLGASNMVEIKVADTIDLAGFARRKAGRYGGHEGLSGFGCLSRYRSFPGYRFCFG